MKIEVEEIINDALSKLRDRGYDTKDTYCLTKDGEVEEIKIKIIGRLD